LIHSKLTILQYVVFVMTRYGRCEWTCTCWITMVT